jgi:transcriptional regulator with XRE-family HTH domain
MPARKTIVEADPLNSQVSDRVKAQRQQRGWSLEQLSSASGVSRSMLSQVERGEANPTLAVTCKIAQAFGMSLAEFVDVPGAGVAIHVVRSDDRAALYRSDEHCEIRTLSPLHLEKDVEFYQVRLKPGGSLNSAAQFLTVEQGKLRVTSGTEKSELNRGDSASYRADVPHVLENLGKSDATVFLVVIYQ